MRAIKKFLFGGSVAKGLPEDVRLALDAWHDLPAAEQGNSHFMTRYVAVDVATAGLNSKEDALLGLAGVGLSNGVIVSDDAFALDLPADGGEDIERRLTAFLAFLGKTTLITYHVPFVNGFLDVAYERYLGESFKADWIDLAWLLPSLFSEKVDELVPLDVWLKVFNVDVPGRRDALADSVAVARLFQVAVVRGIERGADTPAKLAEIAKARKWLRHSG